MRTRRSDPATPGYRRLRQGKGFRYVDADGRPLPAEEVARVKALVIPPAWTDVWICPDPAGHIQAVGTDAAGRRQYRYHDAWRARQDRQKYAHAVEVAEALPRLRRRLRRDLAGRELSRTRVVAAAVALIDATWVRVGSDGYPTYGVATLQVEHVSVRGGTARLCFPAKGGAQQEVEVDDARLVPVLAALRRGKRAGQRLFTYRDGSRSRRVRASDINDYLREATGRDVTAKDFRTVHATVSAAAKLAEEPVPAAPTRRRRRVAAVMREVADELGDTPAVVRSSYVDPRVVDKYHEGATVPEPDAAEERLERQVIDLL
jgi:DNA topoisomerase I